MFSGDELEDGELHLKSIRKERHYPFIFCKFQLRNVPKFKSSDCDNYSILSYPCSNCAALLQQCAPFVSSDVNILDIIFLSGSRKRQSLQDIRVITAVGFPEELPTTGGTPFLPPPVLIQAITNNAEEFENVTGLLLNGSPTLFFVPPTDLFPFDFNEIAVIVLPIVVSVLVLALVIGIAIVLVVV